MKMGDKIKQEKIENELIELTLNKKGMHKEDNLRARVQN
jgi:hypothetical protein